MNINSSIPQSQIQETMARLSYFDGWGKSPLSRLAAGARQYSTSKNDRIVSKGNPVDFLYIVVSGQIRLFIPLSNGAERVVSQVGRGESFGESCLIAGQPCPYDAVAGRKSHIIAIDGLVFRQTLQQNPALVERTLKLISERLLQTVRDIEICAQPSSVQRVARYLMHLEPAQPDSKPLPDNFEIQLPALKRDIAAKLGLTQETFSRMLAFMTKQGFIQVRGSQIKINHRSKLLHMTTTGCPIEVSEIN
jgi:CRP-like cAMP-binding protein